MFFNRIVSWLTGYLELLVRGPQLEKFINLATNSGLFLWDIRRVGPDVLHAKLRAHGFWRVREYAKRSHATIRLHRKRGWPFCWRKLKQRRSFLVGSVLFIAGLIYLSSLVLVLKIDGFEGTDRVRLLTTLGRLGIKPGISRKELLAKKTLIEREVMLETPQAVWFAINLRGVVADMTVVKRKTAPAAPPSVDLIAARDGVVTKVVVVRGTSAVKEGDTVAPGDLLISGTEWQADKNTGELHRITVPANGIIEARVWQDIEVIEPKVCWRASPGRERLTIYSLRWGEQQWTLWRSGKGPLTDYSGSRWRKRLYQGRNPHDTVELIKDIQQAVRWQKVRRTQTELKTSAVREAAERRKLLIGTVAGSNERRTEAWIDEGNFLRLIVTYEMNQNIALVAPIRKE